MKIVIAPDSYKESLSAMDVATQIEAGFREIYPDAEYVKLPVADGGEGTVEAMVAATGDIYYGLWYPVIVAAMTFVIGMLFIRETKDVDIYAKD
mgnify:CR=1 FL=1